MKIFIVMLIAALPAQPQDFTGYFAAANWQFHKSANSSGDVNYVYAPEGLVINGSDGPQDFQVTTTLSILIDRPGRFSFDWEFASADHRSDPAKDPAGVIINQVFYDLTKYAPGCYQSGYFIVENLQPGDVFGFRVVSADNILGNSTLLIKNFRYPTRPAVIGKIYPNPTTGFLSVTLPPHDGLRDYFIINSVGQVMRRGKTNRDVLQEDVSELTSGWYVLKIGNELYRFIKY